MLHFFEKGGGEVAFDPRRGGNYVCFPRGGGKETSTDRRLSEGGKRGKGREIISLSLLRREKKGNEGTYH